MSEDLISFKAFDNDSAVKFFEAVQRTRQQKGLKQVRIRVYVDILHFTFLIIKMNFRGLSKICKSL